MSDPTKCIHGRNFCLECHSTAGESLMFQQLEICQKQRDNDQSQLAALREELATLHDQHAEQSCVFCNNSGELLTEVKSLKQRLADAERRNAELEKNAARYIWLRDKSESVHQFYLSTPIWFTGVKFNQESVDSAIDAAITPNPEAASHDE